MLPNSPHCTAVGCFRHASGSAGCIWAHLGVILRKRTQSGRKGRKCIAHVDDHVQTAPRAVGAVLNNLTVGFAVELALGRWQRRIERKCLALPVALLPRKVPNDVKRFLEQNAPDERELSTACSIVSLQSAECGNEEVLLEIVKIGRAKSELPKQRMGARG